VVATFAASAAAVPVAAITATSAYNLTRVMNIVGFKPLMSAIVARAWLLTDFLGRAFSRFYTAWTHSRRSSQEEVAPNTKQLIRLYVLTGMRLKVRIFWKKWT
jgi:hypothetical protein